MTSTATDWLAIHRVCMRMARTRGLCRQDAEDVAQEAIARTWEAKPRAPMAYAVRCAENQMGSPYVRPWSEAS